MNKENNTQGNEIKKDFYIMETKYYKVEAISKRDASEIFYESDYKNHLEIDSEEIVLAEDEWERKWG